MINMKANIERSRNPQLPVNITVSLWNYIKQSLGPTLYGLQNGHFSSPSIPGKHGQDQNAQSLEKGILFLKMKIPSYRVRSKQATFELDMEKNSKSNCEQ